MKAAKEQEDKNIKQFSNGQSKRLDRNVRQTCIMVAIGIILLFVFIGSNIGLSRVSQEQLENTMYLNQYRLGSKLLTASVQGYAATGDKTYYNDYMKELNEDKNRDIAWSGLKANNLKDSEWKQLEHIADMSNNLVPIEENAMSKVQEGNLTEAQGYVFGNDYASVVKEINSSTDSCIQDIQSRMSSTKSKFNIAMYVSMVMFIVAFLFIVQRIRSMVVFSKQELLAPIVKVSDQLRELAQGHFVNNMDLKEDDSEVGMMVGAINFMNNNFTNMISELSEVLGQMGQGNYNVEITKEYVGEFVKIKESMIKIIADTKKTLSTIQNAAEEIGSGSEQLATASSDLAEGCTIQASKIAETTVMIDDIAKSMEEKANEAKETAEISRQAAKVVEDGNNKMQELKVAINEISECSKEIHSIIEVIEDIAEQTNLLSLNASIEAARAGEAGKGFAVVAEQVKHLAEQSTQAAGETTRLIQNTIDAVDKGIVIADATEANMTDVMQGAKGATEKMIEMAESLGKEVESIQLIDKNISHIAEIVDNNSASSEETAAISEEQSAQVQTMVHMVEKFQV